MILAKTLLVERESGKRKNEITDVRIGNMIVNGGLLREEGAVKNFA